MSTHYIMSSNFIVVNIDGESHTLSNDHPGYFSIAEHLFDVQVGNSELDVDYLQKMLDVDKFVEHFSEGSLVIQGDKVLLHGEELQNTVTEVILEQIRNGQDITAISRFLRKVMCNTKKECVDAFWHFVSRCGLRITTDGDVLGYKGVRQDWMDIWSRKYKNSPGSHIYDERAMMDESDYTLCSSGFHIGTLDYATSYASGGRIVLCRFNPKDVIAVPHEGMASKIRVCEYWVMQEHNSNELLPHYVYEVIDNAVVPPYNEKTFESLIDKYAESMGAFDNGTSEHWRDDDEDEEYYDDDDDYEYDEDSAF